MVCILLEDVRSFEKVQHQPSTVDKTAISPVSMVMRCLRSNFSAVGSSRSTKVGGGSTGLSSARLRLLGHCVPPSENCHCPALNAPTQTSVSGFLRRYSMRDSLRIGSSSDRQEHPQFSPDPMIKAGKVQKSLLSKCQDQLKLER